MRPLGNYFLYKYENIIKDYLVPRVPRVIGTRFLTSLTIIWTPLLGLCYYYAAMNKYFLILTSLVILFQWITDMLDGAVGRYRKEGYVKWGYFMDHLLDYFFLSAGFIGYIFYMGNTFFFLTLIIWFEMSVLFIISFLYYGATKKLDISALNLSVGEIRIIIVVINLIYFSFTIRQNILIWSHYFVVGILAFVILYKSIMISKELENLDKKQNVRKC
ncbi:MAG: CDP-alcohol phosphatidyltransferase family protein [archaeon]